MDRFTKKNNLFTLIVIVFILALTVNTDSYAQMNRRQIKKNSKQMRNFRGKKNVFGKGRVYNYAGLSLNALNYFGDLAPMPSRFSTEFKYTAPSVGLAFGHRFGPFYSLRGELSYGTLKGDDFESADPYNESAKYRYVRNLQFRNRIKELSITGVFDLYKNENTYISRVKFTPYAYVGMSIFHHNPQAKVNASSSLPEAGTWVDLQPLGTEGQHLNLPDTVVNFGTKPYSKIQISIPVGIGMRWKLTDLMDFSVEFGPRILFTDYIDDVSGNYIDLMHFTDPLARELSDRSQEATSAVTGDTRIAEVVNGVGGPIIAGRGGFDTFGGYGREFKYNYRGNSKNNDIYFVTTIRLTYILESKYRKAKFR